MSTSKGADQQSEPTEPTPKRQRIISEEDGTTSLELSGSSLECGICMESNESVGAHHCSTCKPDAWSVCANCDESLISRACPFCNGDYKPRELFACEDLIHRALQEEGETLEEPQVIAFLNSMQFQRLAFITLSNVAIYTPDDNKLWFSLPIDTTVPKKDIRFLRMSKIATPAERRDIGVSSRLLFSNKTWDELVAREEEEEEGEGADEAVEEDEGDVPGAVDVDEPVVEAAALAVDAESSLSPIPVSRETEVQLEQELEGEVEEGGVPAAAAATTAEEHDIGDTVRWALAQLALPGAKLFTRMTPGEVRAVLGDAKEALIK